LLLQFARHDPEHHMNVPLHFMQVKPRVPSQARVSASPLATAGCSTNSPLQPVESRRLRTQMLRLRTFIQVPSPAPRAMLVRPIDISALVPNVLYAIYLDSEYK
jgi:hypothetical protein